MDGTMNDLSVVDEPPTREEFKKHPYWVVVIGTSNNFEVVQTSYDSFRNVDAASDYLNDVKRWLTAYPEEIIKASLYRTAIFIVTRLKGDKTETTKVLWATGWTLGAQQAWINRGRCKAEYLFKWDAIQQDSVPEEAVVVGKRRGGRKKVGQAITSKASPEAPQPPSEPVKLSKGPIAKRAVPKAPAATQDPQDGPVVGVKQRKLQRVKPKPEVSETPGIKRKGFTCKVGGCGKVFDNVRGMKMHAYADHGITPDWSA